MLTTKDIIKMREQKDYSQIIQLEQKREREELVNCIDTISIEEVRKFTNLIKEYSRMESWISSLQEENKKLREEHYKNEELQQMKERVEKAEKDLYRGFPITEEEDKRLKEWINNHEKEHSGGHGCCGGKYTYIFLPTSIGTIGTVKCSCGKSFDFQEI